MTPLLIRISHKAALDLAQAVWSLAAPPPDLTLSDWADQERRLSPESSPEPGRWVTARAEYQRGIMDAISDKQTHTVVLMSSSQVGKSEILLNLIGYHVHRDPAPLLMVQPSLDAAESFSKERLAPMIRDTPALASRIAPVRARDSGNTILHKSFPGGHLSLVGANSPAGLSSRPVRVVVGDEVDRYEQSAGTEGDPVTLAIKRTTNFWNRKIVLASTPGTRGLSRIERAFEGSDQRRFLVPCPDCGHAQRLVWARVVWSKEEGTHRPETAHYACEACGSLWDDGQRLNAVRHGQWIAERPFRGIAGFHLNELYSPWRRLSETVSDFLAAKDAPELLKAWTNTALGETWEDQAERLDASGLLSRGETYDETCVPSPVRLVTAGIDVQGDRLECSRWGWGVGEESWLIEHQIILGDPAQPAIWDELDDWLATDCQSETGARLKTRAACIDMGGHHTQAVLKFCRDRKGRRIHAVIGMGGSRPIWTPKASKSKLGKLSFYGVGVDTAKDTIYARLQIEGPDTMSEPPTQPQQAERTGLSSHALQPDHASHPGYVHLPLSVTASFVAQLVAEVVQVRMVKGRPVREWVLPSGKRNEALDCAVYALAARESFGRQGLRRQYATATQTNEAEAETGNALGQTLVSVAVTSTTARTDATPQKLLACPMRIRRQPWAAYRP
ncbi:phage terminase large subunit family protein [Mesorhizobium sp. RP14(2022)]|uniref:Phage terminase large subunit family protein n=1 Tax=Mesorhizobium liriopis TaxID=2953882 RepID=A0ABT1CBY6_9HYPH|nr:phage terminase large subunit family protein [Mesorhizobium liriopis]MCO6052330.1 phage terminase large subunit family protein [Mesorhizobium liriopis]